MIDRVIIVVTIAVAGAYAAFCVWLAVRIVNRRERWARWAAVCALIALPFLYALSSGPMKLIGWRSQKNPPPGFPIPAGLTNGNVEANLRVEYVEIRDWWHRCYSPLFWASQKPWGTPVLLYWGLFPVRPEPEALP